MANILLVDDDKDVLVLAQKVLESAQHKVFSAQDALSAMDLLSQQYVDLLISDANMPLYNGYDLIRTLRKDDRYRNLGLVMLTGRRERTDIEKAIRLGIDDYIVKPIDPTLFLRKIDSILAKRPKEKKPEVTLSEHSPQSVAYIRSRIRIAAISEEGLVLKSEDPIQLGSILEIDSNFFFELGIHTPNVKVTSCVPSEASADTWELFGQFVGLKENSLQRIRTWMISQGPHTSPKVKVV